MDSNQYLELEWPSKRIPPGGIFHNTKTQYSPEVHDVMKVIMEESKLTLSQRRQVNWCLRTGSSLADIKSPSKQLRRKSALNPSESYPKISRRRSLTAIKNSGDFERERYRPNHRIEDRDVIKKQLQEIMEFGKLQQNMTKLKINKKRTQKTLPLQEEIFHDLLTQIKERAEWLEEMESLGEGAKHREVIQHQIAERIKKIEALKLQISSRFDENDKIKDAGLSNKDNINDKSHKSSPKESDIESLANMSIASSSLQNSNKEKNTTNLKSKVNHHNIKEKKKSIKNTNNQKKEENISDLISICSIKRKV